LLAQEVRSFPKDYKDGLQRSVDNWVAALYNEKYNIGDEQRTRFESAIKDSVRASLSRGWHPEVLANKYPRLNGSVALIISAVICCILAIFNPVNPFPVLKGGTTAVAVYIIIFILAWARAFINAKFFYTRSLLIFIKLSEAALFMVATRQVSQSFVNHVTHPLVTAAHETGFETIVHDTNVYEALRASFWVLSVVCLVGLAITLREEYLAVKVNEEFRYRYIDFPCRKSVYFSSILILGLFSCVIYLSGELDADRKAMLNRELHTLAGIASKPWARQMRRSYGMAGVSIASYAPKIALTLNTWEMRTAIVNAALPDVRKEMIDALTNAANGNWHLITTGDLNEQHRYARIFRGLRHLAAIVIAIGVALVLLAYCSRVLPGIYLQTIVLLCITYAANELFALIDPNSRTALEAAKRAWRGTSEERT